MTFARPTATCYYRTSNHFTCNFIFRKCPQGTPQPPYQAPSTCVWLGPPVCGRAGAQVCGCAGVQVRRCADAQVRREHHEPPLEPQSPAEPQLPAPPPLKPTPFEDVARPPEADATPCTTRRQAGAGQRRGRSARPGRGPLFPSALNFTRPLSNLRFTQGPRSPVCALGPAFLSESPLPERLSGGAEGPRQGRGRRRVRAVHGTPGRQRRTVGSFGNTLRDD